MEIVKAAIRDIWYQTRTDIGVFMIGSGIIFGMMVTFQEPPPLPIILLGYLGTAGMAIMVRLLSSPPQPEFPKLATIAILPGLLTVPTFLLTGCAIGPWLINN